MLAARETKMLSAERMERMIDAPTNDEAAKILEECGYGDLSGLSAKAAGAALEAHIAALFDEVEGMVPEAQLVQLFRLKYDYHNAKALIKAQAMGVECDAILSQRGTIPPQKLHAAFYEEDYRDIPSVLAQAMVNAAAILAHTANPQAADFELDRAYFAQMLDLANGLSDGGFARDYVQLQIDSANLRAAVRTRRMAKDEDFLKTALIPGGTIGTDRVLTAFDSAEALTALYGNTWLGNAAAAGAAAMSGGALTAFELLCDNALMDYIRAAKLRSFGAAHVTAYLAAMENETFRTIVSTKSATVDGQTLVNHNRLLRSYDGAVGVKTGYTKTAGRTLVSCAQRGATQFVCVTLSDPDDWNDHTHLLDWAFENYEYRCVAGDTPVYAVPVLSATVELCAAVPEEPAYLLVHPDDPVVLKTELPRFAFAPVEQGARAGTLTATGPDGQSVTVPLCYAEPAALDPDVKITPLARLGRLWTHACRYFSSYYPVS